MIFYKFSVTVLHNLNIYLGLTVLWFIFMTYLSHQDGEHTGKASLGLAKKLKFLGSNINKLNSHLRKTAHVFLFFIFILLLNITLKSMELQIGYGVIVAVFWAWADEKTKLFIKGRHFSWFDVCLNVLGIALGIIVDILLSKI